MRRAVLLEIYQSIDGLPIDHTAKASVRQMLCRIGSDEGVKGIENALRIQYARDLLAKNCSKTTVMERLRARYGISRETAYRHIREISDQCQKST